MLIKVVFVTSVLVIGEGLAANIAKLKECDGQICTKDQYCSTFNDKCEPCSDICDPGTHNYHEKDCFTYCPGRFIYTGGFQIASFKWKFVDFSILYSKCIYKYFN